MYKLKYTSGEKVISIDAFLKEIFLSFCNMKSSNYEEEKFNKRYISIQVYSLHSFDLFSQYIYSFHFL